MNQVYHSNINLIKILTKQFLYFNNPIPGGVGAKTIFSWAKLLMNGLIGRPLDCSEFKFDGNSKVQRLLKLRSECLFHRF